MRLAARVVICCVLLMACTVNLPAQDAHSDIEWYRGFFQTKKERSADPVAPVVKKLKDASENHNAPAEIRALQELGLLHLTQTHDYAQSMDYLIRALRLSDSLQLSRQQIFSTLIIAQVFHEVGNYPKSADFLEQALSLNKKNDDPEIEVLILNDLGKVNTSLGKIPEAFSYYERVVAFQDRLRQPAAEAEALSHIGLLHQLQGEYNQALDFQKKALTLRRSIQDKKNEARILNDVGILYNLMKNRAKELANHEAALGIRQAVKDKDGIAESANMIAAYWLREKDYKKAFYHLDLALRAGQESQNQEQLGKTYDYLSQSYQATNNFKKALEYKDLLLKLSDFANHEKDEQRLLETQNQYALGLKETAIAKLEVDRVQREKLLSEEKTIRTGLLILIGLGAVIAALILYLYFDKRKSNKLLTAAHRQVNTQNAALKELNATKDKFFSIIGHDLKGPLNSLSSFSNLLSNHLDSLTQDEIKMLSRDLDKQLKNLFALLENLLERARSQTGNIEFTPEVFGIGVILEQNRSLLEGQAQAKNISLLLGEQTSITVSAHRQSISTVVRNLISNAIKFTPKGGAIMIDAKLTDAAVTVSVSDTGVGMSQEVLLKLFRIDTKHSTRGTAEEKGTGLGLILCKDFVEKNGGRIWVESEVGQGSVFQFTIPHS